MLGDDIGMAIDANQVWDVPTAIAWITELAPFRPAWVEEPTAPEDILGTAAIRRGVRPVKVATGEHVANRVMFKQLLQAGAIDIMQIDACRVAGVNENIANLLLAAKFGVPVCPHAGGSGPVRDCPAPVDVRLRGPVRQHAGAPDRVDRPPARALRRARRGNSAAATARRKPPGASTEMLPEALAEYCLPARAPRGSTWHPDPRGPLVFGGAPDRRAVRAGQRRGGRRDAGGGVGRRDPRLRHRAALRGGAVRAADRRFPGRAPPRAEFIVSTKVGRLLVPAADAAWTASTGSTARPS